MIFHFIMVLHKFYCVVFVKPNGQRPIYHYSNARNGLTYGYATSTLLRKNHCRQRMIHLFIHQYISQSYNVCIYINMHLYTLYIHIYIYIYTSVEMSIFIHIYNIHDIHILHNWSFCSKVSLLELLVVFSSIVVYFKQHVKVV